MTTAERMQKMRKKRAQAGLVKVEVWVPSGSKHVVKELERKLNKP